MSISLERMRTLLVDAVVGAEPGLDAADALCRACTGAFQVDGAAVSMVLGGESRGTFGSSSQASRRLDEYQFTFGEGPCLDAVATRRPVLVPDLDSPEEDRWPALTGALIDEGVRGVFAVPIRVASVCVGALDLFRSTPGPLEAAQLTGARLAAELASSAVRDLLDRAEAVDDADVAPDEAWAGAAGMDRVEIYQATGMLISQLDVDADTALVRLRAHAVATGRTASEVAWAIIARELVLERDDPPPPEEEERS